MSNRSLLELNHDYPPSREGLSWLAAMNEFLRSGDPKSLPQGVTHIQTRHHSDPASAGCPPTAIVSRDQRQTVVARWCAAAFGNDQAASIPQRGIRLLEEAIEAAQAAGVPADMAHRMVDHVYRNPTGDLRQELGGVAVTLLALANAAGLSAEEAEVAEVARVLAKPAELFTARNRAKNEAGFLLAPSQDDSDV